MAPAVMPKVKLAAIVDDRSKHAYYRMINDEHERIVSAIEKRDDAAARTHMRAHLTAAIVRLQKLADTLPEKLAADAYETSPDLMQLLARGLADD